MCSIEIVTGEMGGAVVICNDPFQGAILVSQKQKTLLIV